MERLLKDVSVEEVVEQLEKPKLVFECSEPIKFPIFESNKQYVGFKKYGNAIHDSKTVFLSLVDSVQSYNVKPNSRLVFLDIDGSLQLYGTGIFNYYHRSNNWLRNHGFQPIRSKQIIKCIKFNSNREKIRIKNQEVYQYIEDYFKNYKK